MFILPYKERIEGGGDNKRNDNYSFLYFYWDNHINSLLVIPLTKKRSIVFVFYFFMFGTD